MSVTKSRVNLCLLVTEPGAAAVPFGLSGGIREEAEGTAGSSNHCRAPSGKNKKTTRTCEPYCLFNVVTDASETTDLASNASYSNVIHHMLQRLEESAKTGPNTSLAYPFSKQEAAAMSKSMCALALETGFAEPFDVNISDVTGGALA
jgi:hypothetical protein